jgi:hypothetical protein
MGKPRFEQRAPSNTWLKNGQAPIDTRADCGRADGGKRTQKLPQRDKTEPSRTGSEKQQALWPPQKIIRESKTLAQRSCESKRWNASRQRVLSRKRMDSCAAREAQVLLS